MQAQFWTTSIIDHHQQLGKSGWLNSKVFQIWLGFFSPKRIQVQLFIQWLKNKVSKFCFESELSASLHWIFKCIWLFIISFSFNHVYAFGSCPGCYNLFCMANIQIELCISIFLKLNFCAVHPYSQLKRPTPLLYTQYMSH